ncbi:MAG: hypothetical protein L6R38_004006 [Xanthoria sp. 2 TBL-2021]|nr:MAG: hypothetical protein L6R38_004006 [Xanthoria sp. 2 TBL-2021]
MTSSASSHSHHLTLGAPAGGSEGTLSSNHGRKSTAVPATQSLLDRRYKAFGGRIQANPRVLPLNLGNLTNPSFPPTSESHLSHSPPATTHTSIPGDLRSAPIDIPICKPSTPQPSTPWPLTGRERSGLPTGSFFPRLPEFSHTSPEQATDKGHTPSPDSQSQSSQSEREHFALSPSIRRSMKVDHGETSPLYMPASPLSSTAPVPSVPASRQPNARPSSSSQHGRRQRAALAIPSLPAFHPANYESRNFSPHSSRAASSPHRRQVSEAQRQYQQHQRELILNYTRNAARNNGETPVPQPSSPRLNPLGSPGPITPLTLEGQSDYFVSGSRKGSTSHLKGKERREIVERMIGLERDRIRYPERAERHSPAVSPAGGPG